MQSSSGSHCLWLILLCAGSLCLLAGPSSSALVAAAAASTVKDSEDSFGNSPVILVPGNGGSQLWARLKDTENHWYCQRSTQNGPLLLWVQLSNLVYPSVKCLAYNLMLRRQQESAFHPNGAANASTIDNVGVDAFVPGFGTVDTMQWIGDWRSKFTAYYSTLVDHLVDRHGYTRNVTIRGAPYDFRKAPNEFSGYFQQLKSLIEDAHARAGGRKVVLVAHSMGAKLVLHFLHTQPQEWKDKFVKHFVAAGAAFGGVSTTLLAILSGYNLGIPLVKPLWFRPVQRSWPSTQYLLPHPAAFPADQALVTDPHGLSYTVANLSALLSRLGHSEPDLVTFQRTRSLTDVLRPPGVPTTCVFGADVPTPGGFRWTGGDFPDGQPDIVSHESGDGTVAMATQRVCRAWARRQSAGVRVTSLPGAQHMALLTDDRFINVVASIAVEN